MWKLIRNVLSFLWLANRAFQAWNYLSSGLMNPDTHLGENARHREVSDDQITPCLYPRV